MFKGREGGCGNRDWILREVAHAGLTEAEARAGRRGDYVGVRFWPMDRVDRAGG